MLWSILVLLPLLKFSPLELTSILVRFIIASNSFVLCAMELGYGYLLFS